MPKYSKCPNCAKEGLTVPLSEDKDELTCALCDSSFNSKLVEQKKIRE